MNLPSIPPLNQNVRYQGRLVPQAGHPEVTLVWSSNLCPRRPPMADMKAFAVRWAKLNGYTPAI
jgi:hypothetical protein